jgi:hypothetical protein
MQTFTCEGGRRCRTSEQKDDKITFSRQDWRCSRPLVRRLFQPKLQLSNHVQESGAQEGKNLRPAVYCVRFGPVPAFSRLGIVFRLQNPDTLSTPKREDAVIPHVRMGDAAVAYPPKRYRQVGHRHKSRHRPGHATGHSLHRIFQASRAPTYYSSKTRISNPG